MRPMEVEVRADVRGLLPGADFADAFAIVVDDPSLDAVVAAHRAIDRPPGWISGLMWLRDLFVRPLGLVTRHDRKFVAQQRIGAFPVLSESPERVVMGMADKHLDFRLAIEVAVVDGRRRQVIATTLVRTHNLLGRVYLAIVLPFHRCIVPSMMARTATQA